MDEDTKAHERRGGRRRTVAPTCNAVEDFAIDGTPRACGGELVEAVQEAGVVVYCKRCGAVDRRSTEGNRRRAELELAALCARIERQLNAALPMIDSLEETIGYLAVRIDGNDRDLEARRQDVYTLERKVEDSQYTANEAKREAESARQSAERAGRGW